MGKSTISMAIFNSYVSHYQRVAVAKKQIKKVIESKMGVVPKMPSFQDEKRMQ